jgi:hypothetical protein
VSESAFRAKANSIRRDFTRRANAGSSSPTALRSTLSTIEQGIARLDRLDPPARDAATYSDFLRRLKRLLAFAQTKGPELVTLTKQLEQAIPREHAKYGARQSLRRFKQLSQRIRALEAPVEKDVHVSNVEARSLHLEACVVGGTGG